LAFNKLALESNNEIKEQLTIYFDSELLLGQ